MSSYRFRVALAAGILCLPAMPAFAQKDPGVRGGFQNTAGALQQRGIPIPHPPVISPNPTTGATIDPNEPGARDYGKKADMRSCAFHSMSQGLGWKATAVTSFFSETFTW